MLPDINANDGIVRQEGVLIAGCSYLKLLGARVNAEPAPTRTLYRSRSRIELRLEIVKATESLNDGDLERAILENTAFSALGCRRSEVFPEERMVDVATTVELQRLLQCNPLLRGLGLSIRSFGGVEGINIGLMMLRVMKRHDLPADVGFERIVVVRKRRKSVRHYEDA